MAKQLPDLNEAFTYWAWDNYLKTSSKQKLKDYKQADIELKWHKVRLTTLSPTYTRTDGHATTKTEVVFDSRYENETDQDQTHSFRSEKETISTATTKLTKGFTRGVSVGIELPLPTDMLEEAKATSSFGNRMKIDNEDVNTVEKTLKWSVDTTITSKARCTTVAKLEVTEVTSSYDFDVDVKMKGRIIAVIKDARGAMKHQMTVEQDVGTIVKDMKTNKNILHVVENAQVEKKTVIWPVAGSVDFKYGVSQKVTMAYDGQTSSQ